MSTPVQYRCPVCRRLIVVGAFVGWVEGFCPRCGKRRRFDVEVTPAA